MQLVFQVASKQINSNLLAAANEADIIFHAENSTQDFATVRLTSFEKNAGKFPHPPDLVIHFKNHRLIFRSALRTVSCVFEFTQEFSRFCHPPIAMDGI